MKRCSELILICTVLTSLISASVSAQKDSLNVYEGQFSYGNFSTNLILKISVLNDQPTVFFSSPDQNAYDIRTKEVYFDGDSIRFALQSDFYRYDFVGYPTSSNQLDLDLSVNNEVFPMVLDKITESNDKIREREVRFRSGGLLLYGTIYYPDNPNGKAMYFVTSSGDQDRSATRSEARKLTKIGYVTFHADKQGTGMSDGNWQGASIPELCNDDIQAITYLAESNEMAYSEIGIKGSSQGASKVPYILTAIPELGFGIMVSCPGSTLLESDFNNWKNQNRSHISEKDFEEAANLQMAIFKYIAGDVPLDSVQRQIDEKKQTSWFSRIWVPDMESIQQDRKLNYSPLPYMKSISQPVLIIQGNSDKIIPSNSLDVLGKQLIHNNPKNKFVRIENADHAMMFQGESDFEYWPSLHPEYWPTVVEWLKSIEE